MRGLELLLQDFGEISRKALALRDKGKKARDGEGHLAYSVALADLKFFDKEELVWYDGREGFMPEVPIGKPQDYLAIRDDYAALKTFIGKTLDKGKVHAGGGTHGDSSRETNCAEYVVWLHAHSSNQRFRRNVERATTELLAEEFGKEFAQYGFEGALRKASQAFETGHCKGDITKVFFDQNIETTRWRYGLGNPTTTEERAFRAWYDRELEPTIRVESRRNNEACTHFVETSPEFQEAFKQRYLRKEAERSAISDFSPQFNRLVGLLDVVAAIGKHDGQFGELYGMLKQRAEAKFMIDAPTVAHHYSGSNIYQSILVALSAVQQGTTLEQFWLDTIRGDPAPERVIASVHGLLTMQDSKKERQRLIPALLGGLHQRGYDADKGYQRAVIGFYKDENFLEDILGHITTLCFSRETYQHLDKESAALDFLEKKEVAEGVYGFTFTRYTPQGRRNLSASFDVLTDRVEGDTELERTVRAYLNDNGYELPHAVWVTSLEGRRIAGTEAKIVVPNGQNVDGWYEGLVGLNHTHFPFVYDETSGTLLVAEPADEKTVMFGVSGDWKERRMGVDKLKEPVPYSQFQPLSTFGARVNQLVAERKKARYLGDALYSLKDRVSDEIAPYLSRVIRGRLVQHADGLVK